MDHPQLFRRFIEQIRPTPSFRQQLRLAHLDLTRRLLGEPRLKPHIVSTFLQGSYRRSTSIRAAHGKGGSDVDLVVVTRLDPDRHSPERVLKLLTPCLGSHYETWRAQGRSFGIDLDEIHLDLVIASAPSQLIPLENESSADGLEEDSAPTVGERNAWSSEPLQIPDRTTRRWRPSHPLAQLAHTRDKNSRCGPPVSAKLSPPP